MADNDIEIEDDYQGPIDDDGDEVPKLQKHAITWGKRIVCCPCNTACWCVDCVIDCFWGGTKLEEFVIKNGR
eukprot:TRINITY_DN49_c0_g1_i2.p2 TRINITY_DN49_c0_g1~~TRINITY_DN49_c0_g1_i2.p2  ORF type:complete len:72 (+),score=17.78 TRINITY_DN49_c0_g1_i2:57-272(+)